jgi:site-specific DNA-methyltransferase (adenine-specific)
MTYKILQGDNRTTLKTIPDNSIDAIVTDPPYGIDFLGKAWDANTGALETYQECLRVLKPGGHILAFSAARTYHHLAVTLEQAGFEIRDQIMWIYSSGFPKSQDVGKQLNKKGKDGSDWSGWGTALKPAHEPIALARKPTKLAIRDNVQKYGTGALNIDATRVPYASEEDKNSIDHKVPTAAWSGHTIQVDSYEKGGFVKVETNDLGRYPANVIGEILPADYQKYFYCPKVSRKERHMGFDNAKGMFEIARDEGYTTQWDDKVKGHIVLDSNGNKVPDSLLNSLVEKKSGGNNHPTVKPIELMKYLIKLITPPGGTVLDPFNGSGSTGCAAVELGHPYIGCELDPAYVDIALKRIAAWLKKDQVEPAANTFVNLFEEE